MDFHDAAPVTAQEHLPPPVAEERALGDPLEGDVEVADAVAADEVEGVAGGLGRLHGPGVAGDPGRLGRGAHHLRHPPGRLGVGGFRHERGFLLFRLLDLDGHRRRPADRRRGQAQVPETGAVEHREHQEESAGDDEQPHPAGRTHDQEGQDGDARHQQAGAPGGGELAPDEEPGGGGDPHRNGPGGPVPGRRGPGEEGERRQVEAEPDRPAGAADPEAVPDVERPQPVAGHRPVRDQAGRPQRRHPAQTADHQRRPPEDRFQVDAAAGQVEEAPEEGRPGPDVDEEEEQVPGLPAPQETGERQQEDAGEAPGPQQAARNPESPFEHRRQEDQPDGGAPGSDLEHRQGRSAQDREPVGDGDAEVGAQEPGRDPVAVAPAEGEQRDQPFTHGSRSPTRGYEFRGGGGALSVGVDRGQRRFPVTLPRSRRPGPPPGRGAAVPALPSRHSGPGAGRPCWRGSGGGHRAPPAGTRIAG